MSSPTNEHIKQFQALYLKRFGVALSKEEALAKGTQLVHLFEVVLRRNARSEEMSSTGLAYQHKKK